MDDEYAHAEERDPKILVTTSRDPSSRLVQFSKEMKLVLPNAQRINRGGQVGTPPQIIDMSYYSPSSVSGFSRSTVRNQEHAG